MLINRKEVKIHLNILLSSFVATNKHGKKEKLFGEAKGKWWLRRLQKKES